MSRTTPLWKPLIIAALVLPGLGAIAAARAPSPVPPTVTVYKSASCGCCTKWVEHLRTSGFAVTVYDTDDLETVMTNLGVPRPLASCHTAKVGNYVIEGHVPADLVKKLLADHPAILGLAVPGMVSGSPGMEGPNPQHYDVIAWDRTGKTSVYTRR
jgi:hypothetical protein